MSGAPVEAVVKSSELTSTRSCTSDLVKTSKKTLLNSRKLEHNNGLLPETTSKTSLNDRQNYSHFSSFVGTMSEMASMSWLSCRSSRQIASGEGVGSMFGGEASDGGHCLEEAPDDVLALRVQRVAVFT